MQKKRVKQILIRATENELEAIKNNANSSHLSVSEYMRIMSIYGEVK